MKTSIHYFFGLAALLLLTALFPEKGYGQIKVVAKVRAVHCALNTNGAISLSITGGTPPYQFQWSNGSQDQDLEDLPEGQYEVKVTDSKGLKTSARATISTYNSILIKVEVKNISAKGKRDGSITAEVTGGKAPYKYEWSGISQTDNAFPSNATISQLGKGIYTLVVEDSNGCRTVAHAKVKSLDSIQPANK